MRGYSELVPKNVTHSGIKRDRGSPLNIKRAIRMPFYPCFQILTVR